jgi:hypothetical protein
MTSKYIIKFFYRQTYYSGHQYGESDDTRFAYLFDTLEDAKARIEEMGFGHYQIETVYIIPLK